jgi:hypothetical protein
MKKKFSFDPAWVIFFLVASTLLALNFIDDEQSRNLVAGVILLTTAVLFIGAVLLRGLTDRIG